MELLAWGNTELDSSWYVTEKSNCSYIRIYHLTSGSICYSDTAMSCALDTEAVYILPSHAPFTMKPAPGTDTHCTWLHMNIYPVLVKELLSIPYTQKQALLFSLMRCIMEEAYPPAASLSHCAEIFIQALYQIGCLEKPDPAFSPVLDYLCVHFSEDISISDTARQFGYTPEHFIRKFKKETGSTPYQFLTGYRMGKCCELLRKGYPVSSVCALTGYHDIKTFDRAFKKYHGRTASEYQKYFKKIYP